MKTNKRLLSVFLAVAILFSFGSASVQYGIALTYDDDVPYELSDNEIQLILDKLNSNGDDYTEIPNEPPVIPTFNPYIFAPVEYYDPDELSDDEIDVVIERIANGENVLLGVDENDSANNSSSLIAPAWSGGGGTQTHQWMTSRALEILFNEQRTAYNFFTSSERSTMVQFSDWPDANETTGTNSWHFYHYPTQTNYWRESSPTARSRFEFWYNSAVNAWRFNRSVALEDLGKAIHYYQDLGTPVHTGDRCIMVGAVKTWDPVLAGRHSNFETDAQNNRSNYALYTGGYYTWAMNNTLAQMANTNAMGAYNHYNGSQQGSGTSYWAAIQFGLQEGQKDVAGLIYKFYMAVK